MPSFTIETNGRAIVCFGAPSRDEAEELCGAGFIVADLLTLEAKDGTALWDGESELYLREADSEEEAIWDRMVSKAILGEDISSREEAFEENWVVFLVEAYDPEDVTIH